MSKMKKILSIMLVLVLITSLFAGINFYFDDNSEMVSADVEHRDYTILEIVPNESMAQIGYLVGHNQEPINVDSVWDSYKTVLSQFGEMKDGAYKSKNLFEKNYLPLTEGSKDISWNITVLTRTPQNLTQQDLDAANTIVISQTAANKLPTGDSWFSYRNPNIFTASSYNTSTTNFFDNNKFTWDTAYMILKRIAGASGNSNTAPKFFIDYSIYSGAGKSSVNYLRSYADSKYCGYLGEIKMTESNASGSNAFKLYLMLTALNPSTFYSLYFNNEVDTYGITESGYLRGYKDANGGNAIDGNWYIPELYDKWGYDMLSPWFLTSTGSNSFSDIGYTKKNSLGANTADKLGDSGNPTGFAFNLSDGIAAGFSNIKDSSKSDLSKKNDIYTGGFRLLVVDFDHKSDVDGRVAFNFIKNFGKNKGILGGIKVDNVSLVQFAGINKNLLEEYDAIYFNDNEDSIMSSIKNNFGNGNYLAYTSGKSNSKSTNGWGETLLKKYSGRDITAAIKTQLEKFIEKKPVIFAKNLIDKLGNLAQETTNFYQFVNSKKSAANAIIDSDSDGKGISFSTLISKVKDYNLQLVLESQPVTYYDYSEFTFLGQNDKRDYLYSKSADNANRYINSGTDKSRNLNFDFRIEGGSASDKYTLNLYIDMNGDGRFSTKSGAYEEKVAKSGIYSYNALGEKFATVSNITANSGEVQHITFGMADDKNATYKVLPSNYVGPVTWKLEIERSGDKKTSAIVGYSAFKADGAKSTINLLQVVSVDCFQSWGGTNSSNLDAMISSCLLLPTKAEIASVKKGDITALFNESKNSLDDFKNVEKYFDGVLKTQIRRTSGGAIEDYTIRWTDDGGQGENKFRQTVLANSGIYYYMLCQQSDYDINVKRVTTNQLKNEIASGKIYYDDDLGNICYKDPTNESKTVTCDLLVLGFGDYSGDLHDENGNSNTSLKIVEKYLRNGKPAFIGCGAIWPDVSNHKMSQMLVDILGMKNSSNQVQYTYTGDMLTRGNNGPAEATMSNYGTICRYPLALTTLIKSSASRESSYVIDLADDDISVYYSIYQGNNGETAEYSGKNDILNNYLIYKKQSITYCTIGFNEGELGQQKSSIFKLPEAGLLVNAITGSKPGPDNSPEPKENAKIKVIGKDIDKSTVTTSWNGKDYEKPVYTNYVYIDGDKAFDSNTTSSLLTDGAGGDIVLKKQTNTSAEYLCKPVTFKIDYSGDEDVEVKFKASSKNITLTIFDNAGNPVTTLSGGSTYTVYIPIDSKFYKDSGLIDYALINNSNPNKINNLFGLTLYTCTGPAKSDGSYPEAQQELAEIQVGNRGIFRID